MTKRKPYSARRAFSGEIPQMGAVTDEGLMSRYLRWLNLCGAQPSTIDHYYWFLRKVARYIHPVTLREATKSDLEIYLDRGVSNTTRAHDVSSLRKFYKWATEEGYVAADPTLRLVRPRKRQYMARPMPDGDLAVALEVSRFHGGRLPIWLHLATYAGLRAGDIARLRGNDIRWEDNPPQIIVRGKGGSEAMVPLARILLPMLAELPRDGWLFPNRNGTNHVWPGWVSEHCNHFLHSLGITHTLHTIRHWFGTRAYKESGRDLRLTQELMRHRSPSSTAIYTWVDPKEKAAVIELVANSL